MAPSRAPLLCLRSIASTTLRAHTHARQVPMLCIHQQPLTRLHTPPPRYLSSPIRRAYSAQASQSPEPPDHLDKNELHIFKKIAAELEPSKLEVQDISGGCGSMYALEIESSKFKGLSVIKQHKLVNKILEEEIKGWHGVQLRTRAV
ncbi:bola-like protein [Lophiostoma macrostomum CBS 122681]|uniref:Bola-like protein n=1 Tax=Lophiostoma macrostomum CBS 122681 TaxID=1314788 RepID=A0A6A6SSU4_9PLEO|nr:bola-like protein [Lophiostoma macrostomum CBS 122681]